MRKPLIIIPLVALATALAVAAAGCGSTEPATPTDAPPTATPTPMNTTSPTSTPTPEPTDITAATASELLPQIGPLRTYELRNTQEWLNGEPTTIAALGEAGRVILVDFWTYT